MTETEFQIFMAKRPRQNTIRCGFFIGGVWVSVQGGYGKHSTPDTDGAYFYEWEVGYPSEEIAELLPYQSCKGIFSYVPTSVLIRIIDRLGEITERTASPKGDTMTETEEADYWNNYFKSNYK